MKNWIFLIALFFVQSLVAGESKVKEEEEIVPPTDRDIYYGDHRKHTIDFWRVESDSPTPLLVFIHGGGWISGDKNKTGRAVQPFLDAGISCASINYRLTTEAPLPAPVLDAVRAIQYIRYHAKELNIDPEKIALKGGSAGGCTAYWIACHDDLADPDAEDPIARESSRVLGAAAIGAQTTIDPKQILEWIGPEGAKHPMICKAVGEETLEAALENYEKHRELYHEYSTLNHVTADDPPLFVRHGGAMTVPAENGNHGIHHAMFGVKLKERYDEVGARCHFSRSQDELSKQYRDHKPFLIDLLTDGLKPPPESNDGVEE